MIQNPDPKVLELAIRFVRDYITECGPKQPINFDLDVMGQSPLESVAGLFGGTQPRWNDSIFCNALTALVDSGDVIADNDPDLGWIYTIASDSLAPTLA